MHQDSSEVLIFEVNGQRLGLPIGAVQELLAATAITAVTGAAAGIEGVINLRGTVVPVVDVRRTLGMPVKELSPADHFVVVRSAERLYALHVDRALELVPVPAGALAQVAALNPQGTATVAAKLADGVVLVQSLRDLLPAFVAEAPPT